MGHHVDELLVGIVMQIRLRETETEPNLRQKHSLTQRIFQGIMSLVKGKEDKNRLACKNLNILWSQKINEEKLVTWLLMVVAGVEKCKCDDKWNNYLYQSHWASDM